LVVIFAASFVANRIQQKIWILRHKNNNFLETRNVCSYILYRKCTDVTIVFHFFFGTIKDGNYGRAVNGLIRFFTFSNLCGKKFTW
jgi:hypothetical protein